MNAAVEAVQLPAPVARRNITEAQWRTLANNLYPGAAPESVLMVWDYCTARKLDPMKKPCHIVPMQVKDAKTGDKVWRDVVMPGIYEYRTTATRKAIQDLAYGNVSVSCRGFYSAADRALSSRQSPQRTGDQP